MIPIIVSRRLSGDIYRFESIPAESRDRGHHACRDGGNLTFLVEERQCVNDQDLLNSKPLN